MKRVFMSDLHIGDGSMKDDFEFDEELISFLEDALIPGSELIIVGDFLELLENRLIREMGMIPFEDLILSLDEKIIWNIYKPHEKLFTTIRRLSKKHRIKYVVGNHDYYILVNRKLQDALKNAIGEIEIHPLIYDDEMGLLIIHGNQFDLINRFTFDKKRRRIVPPLGDYMTRYIMNRFDGKLENLPKEIGEYDNVKPFFDIDKWFEHVMETYDFGFNILELWMKTVFDMFKSEEFKAWIRANFPKMHWLSKLFLNRVGGMELGKFMTLLASTLKKVRSSDYLMARVKKLLLKNKKLRRNELIGYTVDLDLDHENLNGVVAGHTHVRTFKLFGETKFYINCGAWKPVLERRGKRFVKETEFGYTIVERTKDGFSIEHGNFGKWKEKVFVPIPR